MNRSQMRPRTRPSLMRARPTTITTVTKLTEKLPTAKTGKTGKSRWAKTGPAKTGLAKTGLAKTGLAKTGLAKKASSARKTIARSRLGKPGSGRGGFAKGGFGKSGFAKGGFGPFSKKSRKPGKKTLIAACVAACAAAACVAALPVTRRAYRKLVVKHQTRHITPAALDKLTGLANRIEGERLLGAALERGKARGRRVGVLYVDLDDFKLCNDTYGTEAGDHVLQVTAARMQAQLRSGDTVCRLGGDDFMIIMESAGPDHTVSRVAERISDAIAQPISYQGETILVGGSVGIAVAVNGEGSVDELIAHSDTAVARARSAGRHVVQY